MKQLVQASTALLLGLASAGSLHAQQFRPGWVLPLQGDTLRGEVADAAWRGEPTQVRFRTGPGSEALSYAGSALRAFRVQGGQFFRREVLPLDRQASTRASELPVGLHVQQHPESLLAEVLVDGPATLLHLPVKEVQHYFVQRPGQPAVELTERSYLRVQDGRQRIADGNNFQAVLHQYFGDCPAAAAAADRAAFTPAGLTGIVQVFNQQCSGSGQPGREFVSQLTTHRFATNVGLVGGARYASAVLRNSQSGPLDGLDLDGEMHPVGGVYADLLLPRRRTAVHLAVLFGTFGRAGSVQPARVGSAGNYLHTTQAVVEARLGIRHWLAPGHSATRLLLGTGLTLPTFLNMGESSLQYTLGSGAFTGSYEGSLLDTYPSGLLPYLEVGVSRGRFTLLAEGRLNALTYRDTNGYYRPAEYNVTSFYAGLALNVALRYDKR